MKIPVPKGFPDLGLQSSSSEQPSTGSLPAQDSDSYEDLLRKAAANHGKPRNIEEWARKLAEETGKLND